MVRFGSVQRPFWTNRNRNRNSLRGSVQSSSQGSFSKNGSVPVSVHVWTSLNQSHRVAHTMGNYYLLSVISPLSNISVKIIPFRYPYFSSWRALKTSGVSLLRRSVPVSPPLENAHSQGTADAWIGRKSFAIFAHVGYASACVFEVSRCVRE